MNYRNRNLLNLARDQPCQNCGSQDGTVVAAHSNWGEHGKGKSIKAHDIFIAFLCCKCHMYLDQGTVEPTGLWNASSLDKKEMWRRAHDKTMLLLWRQGKIGVVK